MPLQQNDNQMLLAGLAGMMGQGQGQGGGIFGDIFQTMMRDLLARRSNERIMERQSQSQAAIAQRQYEQMLIALGLPPGTDPRQAAQAVAGQSKQSAAAKIQMEQLKAQQDMRSRVAEGSVSPGMGAEMGAIPQINLPLIEREAGQQRIQGAMGAAQNRGDVPSDVEAKLAFPPEMMETQSGLIANMPETGRADTLAALAAQRERLPTSRDPYTPPVPPKTDPELRSEAYAKEAGKLEAGLAFPDSGTPDEPKDRQSLAAGFYSRMVPAHNQTLAVEEDVNFLKAAYLPNFMQTPEAQQYNRAKSEFVGAQLRWESGAAITQDEIDTAIPRWFPVSGDGPQQMEFKRQARVALLQAMRANAGETAIGRLETERGKLFKLDEWGQGSGMIPPPIEEGVRNNLGRDPVGASLFKKIFGIQE